MPCPKVVPLIARVYPNGTADINHFHAAGGTATLFRTLLDAGMMHGDAATCMGTEFDRFVGEPTLAGDTLVWNPPEAESLDAAILTTVEKPFADEGGVRLLAGNLGRSVIKVSAVAEAHQQVTAPAVVIDDQNALKSLFDAGELNRDCIVVVRFQGPAANGMPELHKLTPMLGVLQDRGHSVALVTDGRMSGASGKVPAAIHLTPEASVGGLLAKVMDGDMIALDAKAGTLELLVSEETLSMRTASTPPKVANTVGRSLFGQARRAVTSAEEGASFILATEE
jgi:Dihydroxyacid dehydratase/phosphogluconate dehydratase